VAILRVAGVLENQLIVRGGYYVYKRGAFSEKWGGVGACISVCVTSGITLTYIRLSLYMTYHQPLCSVPAEAVKVSLGGETGQNSDDLQTALQTVKITGYRINP